MKASDLFTKAISEHLQSLADADPLFAATLRKKNKNITDCVTYILNTVQKSGNNVVHHDEVFNMAVHYYDEDDIKPGSSNKARVVIGKTGSSSKKEAVVIPLSEKIVPKKSGNKQIVIQNQPSLF